MMKTASELLTHARALIAKGWTQGTYARDEEGNKVSRDDGKAITFCTYGALYWAQEKGNELSYGRAFGEAVDLLKDCLPEPDESVEDGWNGDLVRYNDWEGRTQDEVLELFSCAIKGLNS